MDLRGAGCLVTGASSGIGRATALRLAAAGARIVALGRSRPALDEVAARTSGTAVVADLTDPDALGRAVQEARDAVGAIDVLVNNAGEGWAGRFEEMDPADAERLVAVNLLAPIRLVRAVLPDMVQRRRGAIVNVSSIAGHVGVGEEAVYAATKAALITLSESLRDELRGSGVSVGVVSPGVIETPFFERRGRPYDRSFPRPSEPELVAVAVIRAIRTGKQEVYAPRWMAVPARLQGTFPQLYRFLASRFG
ncbi:MAG: SDR family NAD(P)-dependent oxidoreductase [Actinomycetota bacterium]|nr:SDR family NAD(P)-dependent oxidoreductase [Actinomycetota bacterium]